MTALCANCLAIHASDDDNSLCDHFAPEPEDCLCGPGDSCPFSAVCERGSA